MSDTTGLKHIKLSEKDLKTLEQIYNQLDDFSYDVNRNIDYIMEPLAALIVKHNKCQ